jgi:hypothetical protein
LDSNRRFTGCRFIRNGLHTILALMTLTRRFWILAGAAAALPRARAAASVAVRGYRIHATITLLSVPLFSRKDVGGGSIMVEDETAPGGRRRTGLQLVAGSFPERAHSLNRFGFIQELVAETAGEHPELSFFGFMTTSTERTLEDAKKALANNGGGLPITAVEGQARDGRFECRLARSQVPQACGWKECGKLAPAVRTLFSSGSVETSSIATGPGARTFLYTVRQAMQAPVEEFAAPFVYQGKLYELRCRKKAERNKTVRLWGAIQHSATLDKTGFRLWFRPEEPGAPPVRFEFQARSFLRLVFEHDPAGFTGILARSFSA